MLQAEGGAGAKALCILGQVNSLRCLELGVCVGQWWLGMAGLRVKGPELYLAKGLLRILSRGEAYSGLYFRATSLMPMEKIRKPDIVKPESELPH